MVKYIIGLRLYACCPHNILDLSSCYRRQWRIQDFPQGGAPTPKSAIIFQFFPRKLHENERIWTPGGRPWRPPLDPPMEGFLHAYKCYEIYSVLFSFPVHFDE